MTLNLRFGLAEDGRNGWEYRKKAVARLFREHGTDFIATQEANDFQIDYLVRSLPGYKYIGRHHPAPRFWQHNILFYRQAIPCEEHGHFFLSETPQVPSRSFGSQFPRQGTLGLFDFHGTPVICINTHFDFHDRAHMGSCTGPKSNDWPLIQEKSPLSSWATLIRLQKPPVTGGLQETKKMARLEWISRKPSQNPTPVLFMASQGNPLQAI